jgi:hypothetical protein
LKTGSSLLKLWSKTILQSANCQNTLTRSIYTNQWTLKATMKPLLLSSVQFWEYFLLISSKAAAKRTWGC